MDHLEFGPYALITNKNTIVRLTGKYVPTKHVIPHSLCMIAFDCCDYDGYLSDGTNCMCISIPYNHLCGIVYAKKNIKLAYHDLYQYCCENFIYPVHDPTLLGFPETVKVERSSGVVEDSWRITKQTSTYKHQEELIVCVEHAHLPLKKYVTLAMLCKINNLDQCKIQTQLSVNLQIYCEMQ